MIIKKIILIFLAILIVISLSQVFAIPPYSGDIYDVYKSGYFVELDKGFQIIRDSFLNIMMMSKPIYAWLFLEEIQKKHGIEVKVYNADGYEKPAPQVKIESTDHQVYRLINSSEMNVFSETQGSKYYSASPLLQEGRCSFCHASGTGKNIIGVITFKRPYNSYIYYSSERVIIFVIISTMLIAAMVIIFRWNPEKKVKELFDKL